MPVPVPLAPRPLRWLAVVAVAGAIFYFSVLTVTPSPPEPGPLWDKKLHFAAYAALAYALAYATAGRGGEQTRRALLVVGVAVVYGVAIEVVQAPLPRRYFSYADMLANAIGALVVVVWFALESRIEYVPLGR